jgi:hypothetical protein
VSDIDEAGCLEGCASFALATALLLPSSLLDGWVLSNLWRWFVLPLFPAAPHLGVLAATGLALVIAYATHQWVDTETDHGPLETLGHALLHQVLFSGATLAVAGLLLWLR